MKELGSYLFETSRKSPLPPFTRHQDFLLLYIKVRRKPSSFSCMLFGFRVFRNFLKTNDFPLSTIPFLRYNSTNISAEGKFSLRFVEEAHLHLTASAEKSIVVLNYLLHLFFYGFICYRRRK